ncbi:polymorphic toxin-type HINT domain-containing protein [Streptomyces sp. NPDC059629]|uniref:polymorphic toxin-type HINT domain-containing protein n=1 Tax=Streptomyces sp. NPDC059629 TaxID=3346889 RepID=UPI0036947552
MRPNPLQHELGHSSQQHGNGNGASSKNRAETIGLANLAAITDALDHVSDIANPVCWFDSGSCSSDSAATSETMQGLGADTDSPTYKAAYDNARDAFGWAVGGGLGGEFGGEEEGLLKTCSFAPATPVLMDDGTSKPISKIKVGDKVEAANPKTGKRQGARTVHHVWINHDHDLLDLTIRTKNGHTATLHTTTNHPFWDDTTRTWVSAGVLRHGDTLNTSINGHVSVVAVKVTVGAANRWNLTVQQLHTYYVLAGATPVLVHNCNGGTTVYRGVSEISGETGELNPAFDDAAEGIARPRGGDSTPEMHHLGLTDSDYTSWTTSEAAALRAATKGGGNGVVLKGTIPAGRFHVHPNDEPWGDPDLRGEFEVIIQGEMRGTPRAVWPGAGIG